MTLLMRANESLETEYLQEAYYISISGVLMLEKIVELYCIKNKMLLL
jgi:hypothetical protein